MKEVSKRDFECMADVSSAVLGVPTSEGFHILGFAEEINDAPAWAEPKGCYCSYDVISTEGLFDFLAEFDQNCGEVDNWMDVIPSDALYFVSRSVSDIKIDALEHYWGKPCVLALPNKSYSSLLAAERVLVDNGIESDEAEIVLQAIGYVLLDTELYPENGMPDKMVMAGEHVVAPRTGISYTLIDGRRIREYKCPTCQHRWFEDADNAECPDACPHCGSKLYLVDVPDEQIGDNLKISISAYCRYRVSHGYCSDGDCDFCPVNRAYDMADTQPWCYKSDRDSTNEA